MQTYEGGNFGQTPTHIYNVKDKIGIGSSCCVFKGVEKKTGNVRALKVFKDPSWNHSPEKQREVLALSRLRHRNIIGYYGMETELGTGRGVLLMEFCSGGSLQSYLQEPENIHGLRDPEFLLFLRDTCNGCKYLLVCGFVHRDIKPGNILRHVHIDGSVVYKLADFGASKSVGEAGGEFMSLVGTEEYLHPEMYHQAFIRPGSRAVFSVTADIWSLGVTIYHACAGEIPFKPHGGTRSNRTSMYQMITRKPLGAIAGVQLTGSLDSIQWRYTLPGTCPLSPHIQSEAVRIIGGLLESDSGRQWTFTTFEDSIHKLGTLRRIDVVNSDDCKLHPLYIRHTASFQDLKESVAKATGVQSSRQVMIYQNEAIEGMDVKSFIDSSVFDVNEEADVVILVNKDESNGLLPTPTLEHPPSFGTAPTVNDDVTTAVRLGFFLYFLVQQMQLSIWAQRALRQAQYCLHSQVTSVLQRVERKFKMLSETCSEKQGRLETLREMEATRAQITHQHDLQVSSSASTARRILNKLHQQLWEMKVELTSIREQVCAPDNVQCPESNAGQNSSTRVVQGSFDSCKLIMKRMRQRQQIVPLSDCETILQEKDKKDLSELCRDCGVHWVNYYRNIHHPQQRIFLETKRTLLQQLERLRYVERKLDSVTKGRRDLSLAITQLSAFSGRAWKDVVSSISTLFNRSMCPGELTGQGSHRVQSLKRSLETNQKRLTVLVEDLPEPERFDLDL